MPRQKQAPDDFKGGSKTPRRRERSNANARRLDAQPPLVGAVATWDADESFPAARSERISAGPSQPDIVPPKPLVMPRGRKAPTAAPVPEPTRRTPAPTPANLAPAPAPAGQMPTPHLADPALRQLANLDLMTVAIEHSIYTKAVGKPPRKSPGQRRRERVHALSISGARLVLGLIVILLVLGGSHRVMTLPPDMRVMHGSADNIGTAPFPGVTTNVNRVVPGLELNLENVTSRVQPFTQMRRSDLYDNTAQFNAWGGSACSAAVTAEILTAYGVRDATIGHVIDDMGNDISLQWGLETYDGFQRAGSVYNFRSDQYVDHRLTYNQMKYLTNTLHIPVIVNVRATSGYYHYLSGGHFMVMTGGDNSNVQLVDSSLYYIKSLPLGTFNWMFTGRTDVIVPADYHYTLPNI